MLQGLFRAFRGGVAEAKVLHVLSHYYNLDATGPSAASRIHRIVENLCDSHNEHEMAVQFLAEFTAKCMQQDHPRAVDEVKRYVRVAGAAYENEAANFMPPYIALLKTAAERFGVRPEDVIEEGPT